MTLEELSLVNNLIFIGILIVVGTFFSLVHLWITKKISLSYWVKTSALFALICFTTITVWHYTIGLI